MKVEIRWCSTNLFPIMLLTYSTKLFSHQVVRPTPTMQRLSLFNLPGPIVILALTCASFVLNWGTYQLRHEDFSRRINIPPFHHGYSEPCIISIYAIDMKLTVTGPSGHALIGGFSFKYWLCPSLVIAAVLLPFVFRGRLWKNWSSLVFATAAVLLTIVGVADLVERGGIASLKYGWLPCAIAATSVIYLSYTTLSHPEPH